MAGSLVGHRDGPRRGRARERGSRETSTLVGHARRRGGHDHDGGAERTPGAPRVGRGAPCGGGLRAAPGGDLCRPRRPGGARLRCGPGVRSTTAQLRGRGPGRRGQRGAAQPLRCSGQAGLRHRRTSAPAVLARIGDARARAAAVLVAELVARRPRRARRPRPVRVTPCDAERGRPRPPAAGRRPPGRAAPVRRCGRAVRSPCRRRGTGRRRASPSQVQSRTASRAAVNHLVAVWKARSAKPLPPGWASCTTTVTLRGVGVAERRTAPHVPPIAVRHQREEGDRGVLRGVYGTFVHGPSAVSVVGSTRRPSSSACGRAGSAGSARAPVRCEPHG